MIHVMKEKKQITKYAPVRLTVWLHVPVQSSFHGY